MQILYFLERIKINSTSISFIYPIENDQTRKEKRAKIKNHVYNTFLMVSNYTYNKIDSNMFSRNITDNSNINETSQSVSQSVYRQVSN